MCLLAAIYFGTTARHFGDQLCFDNLPTFLAFPKALRRASTEWMSGVSPKVELIASNV